MKMINTKNKKSESKHKKKGKNQDTTKKGKEK